MCAEISVHVLLHGLKWGIHIPLHIYAFLLPLHSTSVVQSPPLHGKNIGKSGSVHLPLQASYFFLHLFSSWQVSSSTSSEHFLIQDCSVKWHLPTQNFSVVNVLQSFVHPVPPIESQLLKNPIAKCLDTPQKGPKLKKSNATLFSCEPLS